MNIIAIIWTHNPEIWLLRIVIKQALKNLRKIIVIDNKSANVHEIEKILLSFPQDKVKFVKLPKNLGVHALNIGLQLALQEWPDYILFLDDDSILFDNAIKSIYKYLKGLSSKLLDRIAIISIIDFDHIPKLLKRYIENNSNHWGKLIVHSLPIAFSGSILNTKIILKENINIRKNLFLHGADTELYKRVGKKGYLIAWYANHLMRHRSGIPLTRPLNFLGIEINYIVTPKSYYYIIRNCTILLLEKTISILDWLYVILSFFSILFLKDSSRKLFVKFAILGFSHGLFKKEGYFDFDRLTLKSEYRYSINDIHHKDTSMRNNFV
jgi:rhamnosyltransferase